MAVQITQGAGTPVATVIKDLSQNYQRVVAHRTRCRVSAVQQTGLSTYQPGRYVGSELEVLGVFRAAAEPGLVNSAFVDSIALRLAPGNSACAIDVFVLAAELATPPSDGAAPAMAATENLNAVQAVFSVAEADWQAGLAGDLIAQVEVNRAMYSYLSTDTGLRLAFVARTAAVTLSGTNPLSVAVSAAQD